MTRAWTAVSKRACTQLRDSYNYVDENSPDAGAVLTVGLKDDVPPSRIEI